MDDEGWKPLEEPVGIEWTNRPLVVTLVFVGLALAVLVVLAIV